MATLEQLQQLAAQQGFAKLSADVELPVDVSGVDVRLTHAEISAEWKDGKPTDQIKTRERLDEDTGELATEVQLGCTVQFVQGGAVAPAKLGRMWMGVDAAMALMQGVAQQVRVKLVNPRVVPYIQTYTKEGSSFTNERPAVRWVVDGIELV